MQSKENRFEKDWKGLTRRPMLLLLLFSLIIAGSLISPSKTSLSYASDASLGSFVGVLNPGGSANYTLSLNQDFDNLLLDAKGGGPKTSDSFSISINETSDNWNDIQGESWFIFGPLTAGNYTVGIVANPNASSSVNYQVQFYRVPVVPADFSGYFPAGRSNNSSSIAVKIQSPAVYELNLTASTGNFELNLDGDDLGIITNQNTTFQQLSNGTHALVITADPLNQSVDTRWSIHIAPATNPPMLSLQLLPDCSSTDNQTTCTLVAQVGATDNRSVSPTYEWSSDGGTFNDTTGESVLWIAPALNQTVLYNVTCTVAANGYLGTSATLPLRVQAIPEFNNGTIWIVNVLLLVLTAVTIDKNRRLSNRTLT